LQPQGIEHHRGALNVLNEIYGSESIGIHDGKIIPKNYFVKEKIIFKTSIGNRKLPEIKKQSFFPVGFPLPGERIFTRESFLTFAFLSATFAKK
jgi:hypothetical protein